MSCDEEIPTMVISLGSWGIKAAYAGEKTCRYLSEHVHITSKNDDKTLIQPSADSLPIMDTLNSEITSNSALVTALRMCWSEQYSPILDPSVTRLILVAASSTNAKLTEELGEIAFDELRVRELCIVSSGEAVSVYQNIGTCVVLDIGYKSSRIEVFMDCVRVETKRVMRGGIHIMDTANNGADELFREDELGASIPDILKSVLVTFNVAAVVVTGGASLRLTAAQLSGVVNKEHVKFILAPERNKSSWLGASMIPDISYCQHRFYTRDGWKTRPKYVQLICPESVT